MIKAGLQVVGYDLRHEAVDLLAAEGARGAGSLGELGRIADVVSVVVVDDVQVCDVVTELLGAVRTGTVIIVHSTITPTTVIELAASAAERGAHVIDAPMSGGSERASRGSLSVAVGGEHDVVQRVRPLLDTIGDPVQHVGPVGAGAAAKLVNNLITLGSYVVQMEAMELAASYGLEEDTVATFVSTSSGDSRVMRTWGRMDRLRRERLAGTSVPEWGVYERLSKDLRTAAIAGGRRSLLMPMTVAAASIMPVTARRRQMALEKRDATNALPLCSACGQELAAPFRDAGRHPECAITIGNPRGGRRRGLDGN
jgi:3-hydroxyisobutyrate dehydrogenase-like beta-hydroxyacid dehydrogenase